MTRDQIRDTIRRYVQSSLRVASVSDNDDIVTALGGHSLQLAQLTTFVEKTFSISISSGDRSRLRTLGAIADYVVRQRG